MSSVVISGDTSGAITLAAPAVAGTTTLTLQAATATSAVNTLATAVASTSGTSIDFTGLPSWIKRITVMFNSVSTNGTSNILVQLGAGSITSSGYVSTSAYSTATAISSTNSTAGFVFGQIVAANTCAGSLVITTLGSNIWVANGLTRQATNSTSWTAGDVTLGGTLDRVRITTANGTDTFDAGTINILYEG